MFAANTKVIVVDDMKSTRKFIRAAFSTIGIKDISEADDGATAWPMIEEAAKAAAPFQLIVADWNMPKMQGIELLRRVRAHETMKAVPFILVTAEADQRNLLEAIQSGVSNYIIKPFTQELFEEKLEAVHQQHLS